MDWVDNLLPYPGSQHNKSIDRDFNYGSVCVSVIIHYEEKNNYIKHRKLTEILIAVVIREIEIRGDRKRKTQDAFLQTVLME